MPRAGLAMVVVWVAALAFPGRVSAQGETGATSEPRVSIGGGVTAVSKYIWRGFDEEAGVSLQPSVWLSTGGFTFTAWSNVAMRGGRGLTEQDLSAEYGRSFGSFSVRGGWNGYFLPDSRDSHEAFLAVGREGVLTPTVTVYQDYREGLGTYVSTSIAQPLPWRATKVTIVPSLSLGYNRHQWTDLTGFSDLNVGVKASWQHRNGHVELGPFINYSHTLNADMLPSRTYGGLEVTFK